MFTFHGTVAEDGSWQINVVVPNGATVTSYDVHRALTFAAAAYAKNPPSTRLPTLAEAEAMQAAEIERQRIAKILPDGWEKTNDGASTHMVGMGGPQTFKQTHRRLSDGAIAEVVCANVNGDSCPETVAALNAFDAEHPPQSPAEA